MGQSQSSSWTEPGEPRGDPDGEPHVDPGVEPPDEPHGPSPSEPRTYRLKRKSKTVHRDAPAPTVLPDPPPAEPGPEREPGPV